LPFVSLILFLSGCSALSFSDSLASADRISFWEFDLVRRFDSVELYAGLSLGSAIAARLDSPAEVRTASPLRRIGIDRPVLAAPWYLDFPCSTWLRPIFQAFWHHQELLNILPLSQFRFWFWLFSDPAMGLTLPVLLEDPLLYRRQFGRVIGAFYGLTRWEPSPRPLGRRLPDPKIGTSRHGNYGRLFGLAAAGIAWFSPGTVPPAPKATGSSSR